MSAARLQGAPQPACRPPSLHRGLRVPPPRPARSSLLGAAGQRPCPPPPIPRAPAGSLTAVHLEDGVGHGREHALPVQDVGVPELQGEREGGLWGQQGGRSSLSRAHREPLPPLPPLPTVKVPQPLLGVCSARGGWGSRRLRVVRAWPARPSDLGGHRLCPTLGGHTPREDSRLAAEWAEGLSTPQADLAFPGRAETETVRPLNLLEGASWVLPTSLSL